MGALNSNSQAATQLAQVAVGALLAVPGFLTYVAPKAAEEALLTEPSLTEQSQTCAKIAGLSLMAMGQYFIASPVDRRTYSYFSIAIMPVVYLVHQCFSEQLLNDNGILIVALLVAEILLCSYLSVARNLRVPQPLKVNIYTTVYRNLVLNALFLRGFWFLKSPEQGAEMFFTHPEHTAPINFFLRAFGAVDLLFCVALIFGRLEGSARLCFGFTCLFKGWWQSSQNIALFTTMFRVCARATRGPFPHDML
jgi:uncharacterized protein YjeT (DUF2065 family)